MRSTGVLLFISWTSYFVFYLFDCCGELWLWEHVKCLCYLCMNSCYELMFWMRKRLRGIWFLFNLIRVVCVYVVILCSSLLKLNSNAIMILVIPEELLVTRHWLWIIVVYTILQMELKARLITIWVREMRIGGLSKFFFSVDEIYEGIRRSYSLIGVK